MPFYPGIDPSKEEGQHLAKRRHGIRRRRRPSTGTGERSRCPTTGPCGIELTTDFSAGYLANAMRGKGKTYPFGSEG